MYPSGSLLAALKSFQSFLSKTIIVDKKVYYGRRHHLFNQHLIFLCTRTTMQDHLIPPIPEIPVVESHEIEIILPPTIPSRRAGGGRSPARPPCGRHLSWSCKLSVTTVVQDVRIGVGVWINGINQ